MELTATVFVLGYIFTGFYGFAALYMVFWADCHIPLKWPALFGLIAGLSHFTIHELPEWWPPTITSDMLIAGLLLSVLYMGFELLRHLLVAYAPDEEDGDHDHPADETCGRCG